MTGVSSMNPHPRALAVWIGIVSCLVSCAGQAADKVYREYFPDQKIDYRDGYRGDERWSGTVRYWRDAEAIARHKAFSKDPDLEWKLNSKATDYDTGDLHLEVEFAIEKGQELVGELERKHPGFVRCLADGKDSLRGVAATYPKFDRRLKRVMTVDARIEACASSVAGEEIRQGTIDNISITAYLRAQSNGMPVNVDLGSPEIMRAYRRGEKLFYTRTGRNNFACASCHSPMGMMGRSIRGEIPTTPFGDANHFPAYRSPRFTVESLHERLRMCNFTGGTFPLPHGDDAYVDLEVFLSVLANGYPIMLPAVR